MNAKEFIEKFGVRYNKDGDCLYDSQSEEVEIREESLENYACPKCGDRGVFDIAITARATLSESGIIDTEQEEYNDKSQTKCIDCDYSGPLINFYIRGLDNELRDLFEAGRNADDDDDTEEESAPETPPTEPPKPPAGWDTTGI